MTIEERLDAVEERMEREFAEIKAEIRSEFARLEKALAAISSGRQNIPFVKPMCKEELYEITELYRKEEGNG